MSGNLDLIVKEKAEKWLSGNYDEDTNGRHGYARPCELPEKSLSG